MGSAQRVVGAAAVALLLAAAIGAATLAGAGGDEGDGARGVETDGVDAEVSSASSGDPVGSEATSATEPVASLNCDDAVFGDEVVCEVSGAQTLRWPDDVSTVANEADGSGLGRGTEHRHVVGAVGQLAVEALDDGGRVLATSTVTVRPDLLVECEEGRRVPIYELVPSTALRGWDYVFVHPETGDRIGPGHELHAADPGLTDLEAVVTGEAVRTGKCRLHSEARDRFGGSVEWVMTNAIDEEAVTVPISIAIPFSHGDWLGVQPGEIEVTVTVEGVSAAERRGVYLSGCT